MPLFGVPEWGESPAVNPPLPGCDAANSVMDVWFRLGFLDADDMNVDDRWVTIAELYQFADDAAKRLAYAVGLFLTYDDSIAVLPPGATYALPAGHVFSVLAWLAYAGLPPQLLRPTSVGQLFALDANWPTTVGDPARISNDAAGVGSAVLYPIPVLPATLNLVLQQFPADIVAGASSVPLSPVCQDYFTYAQLAGARGKESDSALPEMAAHFQQRMKLYERIFEHLWGPGL